MTNEENYTSTESIAFSIHTNEQLSQEPITVLAGIAYGTIRYLFNIEVSSI